MILSILYGKECLLDVLILTPQTQLKSNRTPFVKIPSQWTVFITVFFFSIAVDIVSFLIYPKNQQLTV